MLESSDVPSDSDSDYSLMMRKYITTKTKNIPKLSVENCINSQSTSNRKIVANGKYVAKYKFKFPPASRDHADNTA